MKTVICRFVTSILMLSLIASVVTGCGKSNQATAVYSLPKTMEVIDSQIVASNDKLELEWDSVSACILLRSKVSGKVWGTTPYNAYQEGVSTALLSSPISVTVACISDRSLNTKQSYSACITSGNYECKKIDNGLELTFYFDDYQISVPVTYRLREESLEVTIDNSRIAEAEQYKLLSVSVSPMMCSVPNNEDGYLFVPAGTGALMNTDANADDTRVYSQQVYGDDVAQTLLERLYEQESIRLPVFGAKDKTSALFGIVESSPGTVTVTAEAGSTKTDYSSVCATVYTRGSDVYRSAGVSTSSITTLTSDNIADAKTVIGYYPLEGEEADYNGMATCYRNYLIKNGMEKSNVSQNPYGIRFVGNIEQDILRLGVPVTTVKSLTTFKETQNILTELVEATDNKPAVQLVGYGTSGADTEKIAGGFKFSSKSGNGFKNLNTFAKENGIPLFVDFDLMFYKKSGYGISTLSDGAKSATMRKSVVYKRDQATGDYDKDEGASYIVKQKFISKLTDKLLKKTDKYGIEGYSLSTLSSIAYSDYSNTESYCKANIDTVVKENINKIKESGATVASTSANDYAAALSDSIFEVQTEGHNTENIDKYVPFYQMVFKGYVPMYSQSINLASDVERSVLSALETGVGLGFTLIKNHDLSYSLGYHDYLYSSQYEYKKDLIVDTVNKYSDYYKKVSDAKIIKYSVYDNGLCETVFDNGITAYTNKTDSLLQTPVGYIEAKSFFYTENGVKKVA